MRFPSIANVGPVAKPTLEELATVSEQSFLFFYSTIKDSSFCCSILAPTILRLRLLFLVPTTELVNTYAKETLQLPYLIVAR